MADDTTSGTSEQDLDPGEVFSAGGGGNDADESDSDGDPAVGARSPAERSGFREPPRWRFVAASGVVAILAAGLTRTGFFFDVVGERVVGAGFAVATVASAVGVYFLVEAIRAESEAAVGDIIAEIRGLETGPEDPLAVQRELLEQIRRQGHLTRRLLDDLPDQQEDLRTLANELERRNRIVSAVLEEDMGGVAAATEEGDSGDEGEAGRSAVDADDGSDDGDAESASEGSGTETA